jgi:putative membrane protein
MWYGMMGFGGWMIISWIIWIVIIGLIVWGVVVLVRRGGFKSNVTEREDPLEIAKRRYAKGKISKKEFEQIKKDLK